MLHYLYWHMNTGLDTNISQLCLCLLSPATNLPCGPNDHVSNIFMSTFSNCKLGIKYALSNVVFRIETILVLKSLWIHWGHKVIVWSFTYRNRILSSENSLYIYEEYFSKHFWPTVSRKHIDITNERDLDGPFWSELSFSILMKCYCDDQYQ